MEIKQGFFDEMKNILPSNEFDDFCSALNTPYKKGLVVNLNKVSESDFLSNVYYEMKKLPYGQSCFLLDNDNKLGGEILHRAGAFYLQEPSAMIPGIVLPIKNSDIVLDVCASPGGKTFQIARRLQGSMLSNEIDFSRAKTLLSNVERLGLNNVVVSNFSSQDLAKYYPNKFDCIIIDAPCSGEGMFRKEDYAREQWSKEYVLQCANMQNEIIRNINQTLKTGGYLVYSTCTFSIEENEMNVAKLVDMGYEIVDIGTIAGESKGVKIDKYNTDLCKRFYFHKAFGEGQFVALLKKTAQTETSHRKERIIKKVGNSYRKLVVDFVCENADEQLQKLIENNLYAKNDAIYYTKNAELLVRDNAVLSYGVKLGNIVKGRFEPCHNLFTAFGNYFNKQIDVNKKDADKYLKGETLASTLDNGWCVVTYLSVVLGGGKIVNGIVKNHYPKGLRK